MKKAAVLLANGFETVEALAQIDVLRRAQVEAYTVSLEDDLTAVSAQGVEVKCDLNLKADYEKIKDFTIIILPGGVKGAESLRDMPEAQKLIKEFYAEEKLIAAICAAPMALKAAGISPKHKGTAYPGMQEAAGFKEYIDQGVVRDGNIITGQGPAYSFDFGLEILKALAGEEKAAEVKAGLLK